MNDEVDAELRGIWHSLGNTVAFRIERVADEGTTVTRMHDTEAFEVGSCFKAIIAAECCRQADAGTIAWNDGLVISAGDRVPGSECLDALPEGSVLTLREAVQAMLAVSDNTATDLVIRHIGIDNARALVETCGLQATEIPDSTATVYQQATDTVVRACISTMRDLTQFYRAALADNGVLGPIARGQFLEVMRAEDEAQAATWPSGAVCLRKSGSLEPPPIFVQAIAGAFVRPSATTIFAFALNVNVDVMNVAAQAAATFAEGLTMAMRRMDRDA